jgi:hypothetical protein
VTIRDAPAFWAGVTFAGFGAFTLVQIPHYVVGTATRMGPGYFPMLIAIVLVGLGSVAAWRALAAPVAIRIGPWPLVPLAFVVAGVVAFALLIERAGLIAATLCLVVCACYQRLLRRPLEILAVFVAVALLSAAIFIYGIGLPIALW